MHPNSAEMAGVYNTSLWDVILNQKNIDLNGKSKIVKNVGQIRNSHYIRFALFHDLPGWGGVPIIYDYKIMVVFSF